MTLEYAPSYMMNCPACGVIMVWLDGSVLHDPPIKHYECRRCRLAVIKYPDGNYDVTQIEPESGSAPQV